MFGTRLGMELGDRFGDELGLELSALRMKLGTELGAPLGYKRKNLTVRLDRSRARGRLFIFGEFVLSFLTVI